VAATAIDARREGFEVILINDATCPVSLESGSEARQRMKEAGVRMSTDA
jgi:nicotinamidase/pyrazinamidase